MIKTPYSVYERLPYSEMLDVTTLFSDIVKKALTEYPEANIKRIRNWVVDVELLQPHLLFSENNFNFFIAALEDEIVRDFIMRVHFTFFTYAGGVDNWINRLTQNLIDGLCLDGPDQDYSAVIPDIQSLLAISVHHRNKTAIWFEKVFAKLFLSFCATTRGSWWYSYLIYVVWTTSPP